ncbi:DUF202 domain-containing protein [Mycolicibacterium goodii]|uniref:DUF202 domain-containing protein n=1 Tax=Mycolicibacterium goodii TaxID=134601 RepID=UPI000C25CFA4|nr:DUF202 domain-containing protein [Mycolicibacterium goodii]PJK21311.1 hypothetical protein CSX11_16370 [Mycolicibacterium goodii]
MPDPEPGKPGLPAERTLLSWERSSFGFLVGGALLLIRQHGPLSATRTLLAIIAALLALLVLALAHRRSRRIGSWPVATGRRSTLAPHAEVMLTGGAVVAFASAVMVALLYSM